MNTCKTCSHWSKHTRKELIGECNLVDYELNSNSKPLFYLDVYADDDSGLNVMLMTSEDFGCIRHQEK
jgi:hypothetical protein